MSRGSIFNDGDGAVQDDRAFVSLCGALGDRVSFAIIKSTIRGAKTAAEISRESRVPLSSVYRKIGRLDRLGIIKVRRVADGKSGKKVAHYTCRARALRVKIDKDGAKVWLGAAQENSASVAE